MAETLELTDIFLRVAGAFYAFAGLVATRAALTSHFLDRALAAITQKKPSQIEVAQTAWLIGASAVVFAGGVLLLAGLQAAAWVFAASALGQAAYIFFVAPRYFDREDPPDANGRRQTTNAFVIFLAATALVIWAAWRGRLNSFDQATVIELAAVGGAAALYVAYVVRALWWQPKTAASTGSGDDFDDVAYAEDPSRPAQESQRIKLMAEYGCDPLWPLDDGLYGCFPPDDLDLSPELTEAIKAWSDAYQASYDREDLSKQIWGPEQYETHRAEGQRLAALVKRELPERMIYVLDPGQGVVEVQADASDVQR